jgi:hypothetical protein
MRKYEDPIGENKWGETIVERRRGVNLIHLFNEVWRAGQLIHKKDKPAHLVIYSPEDVEFHVYGKEAEDFLSYSERNEKWYVDKTKIKIYILTSILDATENWSFDMTQFPGPGKSVKVIYSKGKITWTTTKENWEESGEEIWEPWLDINHKGQVVEDKSKGKFVHQKIVAWSLQNKRI